MDSTSPSLLPAELLERLAAGPRAERYRGRFDGAEVELRVINPAVLTDEPRFLSQTRRLLEVQHPSLRTVRGLARADDGRLAVVMSLVDWPTLREAAPAPTALLGMALEWTDALRALHDADLVLGVLDGQDLYPGEPAVLDPSLIGLGATEDTVAGDAQMLVRALLSSLAKASLTKATQSKPLEALLSRLSRSVPTALALRDELEVMKSRLETANLPSRPVRMSSGGATARAEVEIAEPTLTGLTLQHWSLGAVLGEGAMARVYLATDVRDGSAHAVKVLKQEQLQDAEALQRFLQEVGAAKTVRHPNVVEMRDLGDVELKPGQRCVFCVMEVLEGRPLSDAMNDERFGAVRAAKLMQQVADGLQAAHHAGIVHRDVKPENLFLEAHGSMETVKLLDFGVAKLFKPIGDVARVGTRAGVVLGTPEYMAPEQMLGRGVDARTDVYAVGLVLYELLTGKLPFEAENFGALVKQVSQHKIPALPEYTTHGDKLPPGLVSVVMRCLAAEPEHRYQTAHELSLALEPYATAGASTDRLPVVVKTDHPEVATPMEQTLAEPTLEPSRVPLIVAGAVLVTMVVIALVILLSAS